MVKRIGAMLGCILFCACTGEDNKSKEKVYLSDVDTCQLDFDGAAAADATDYSGEHFVLLTTKSGSLSSHYLAQQILLSAKGEFAAIQLRLKADAAVSTSLSTNLYELAALSQYTSGSNATENIPIPGALIPVQQADWVTLKFAKPQKLAAGSGYWLVMELGAGSTPVYLSHIAGSGLENGKTTIKTSTRSVALTTSSDTDSGTDSVTSTSTGTATSTSSDTSVTTIYEWADFSETKDDGTFENRQASYRMVRCL